MPASSGISTSPKRIPAKLPNSGMLPAPTPIGGTVTVQRPAKPTFQPPQTGIQPMQAIASQPDPRIADLTKRLQEPAAPVPVNDPRLQQLMSELEQQISTARNEQSGVRARIAALPPSSATTTPQNAQLDALVSELMRGQAPDIGDIQLDPEAKAFRIASQREAGRAREEAANRQAASGSVTGGGGFDARVAGIRERTGENIAGFEATLAGRRRGEALDTARTGATLPGPGGTPDAPLGSPQSSALSEAREAIANGAPKEAVAARLREMGIDPGSL